MEEPMVISEDTLDKTISQLQNSLQVVARDVVEIEEITVKISGSRSATVFSCKLCNFQSKYKTVCLAHIGGCRSRAEESVAGPSAQTEDDEDSNSSQTSFNSQTDMQTENHDPVDDDMYWNYKCSEFLLDAIFAITSNFEKFGDGLGCYIVNKIMLPIFHGLKHSNYSNSIHRFITRVLCEATPKEGLKLIHERFSNRRGKPGQNISRDRRMEYRIGTAKKLIGNLGPNFTKEAIQQVNKTLDIKEELFLVTRKSHGVEIRNGRHNPRSDATDYAMLFTHLTETEAHLKVKGRVFGNLRFCEDLMEDEKFNKVEFNRWLVSKNKEAKITITAKRR